MTVIAAVNQTKLEVFRWRYGLSIPRKLALSLAVAALTGLLAQARIQLPWSPVPLTGQTFGVLLAGVLLGGWWGGVSMTMYAGLGAAGVPWFTGLNGGLAYLAGPTGGYVIGFILAALFLGYFTDRYVRARSFLSMLGLMSFASFILIYGPGLLAARAVARPGERTAGGVHDPAHDGRGALYRRGRHQGRRRGAHRPGRYAEEGLR